MDKKDTIMEEVKYFLENIFKKEYNWFIKPPCSSRELTSLKQKRWKGQLGQGEDINSITMHNLFAYSKHGLRISFSLFYYCMQVGDEFNPAFFSWFQIRVDDEYRRLGKIKLFEIYYSKEDKEAQWLVDTFFAIKSKALQLPLAINNVLPIKLESIEKLL